MPPRRRREGTPTQARTEEQSSARVGVSSRPKAPRSPRRCLLSRGGIPKRSRSVRRASRKSRPWGEANRRPGCSERHEEGLRDLIKSAQLSLRSSASIRDLTPSTKVERDVRKPARVRSRLAGSWCGDASKGLRNRHLFVPASSGAQAFHSRARIDSSSGVPARRIRLQKSSCEAEGPDKRASRWQRGAWTGAQTREDPQGSARAQRRREPAPRWPSRGVGKAQAGRSKGRRGARVLDRWKALQAVPPARSFTRVGRRRPRRPLGGP
jgi:hypothetical protein